MFRTINNLITTGSRALPAFYSPTLLANDFSDYFSNKVSTLRKNIDELDTVTSSDEIDECPQDCATCMSEFRPITQDEVLTIIKKTPTKSCRLDPIPTWLLKEHITSFLPTLTDIVNASLTSGVFPDVLRDAVVTPILKKSLL